MAWPERLLQRKKKSGREIDLIGLERQTHESMAECRFVSSFTYRIAGLTRKIAWGQSYFKSSQHVKMLNK
jgi:hypothetical protein